MAHSIKANLPCITIGDFSHLTFAFFSFHNFWTWAFFCSSGHSTHSSHSDQCECTVSFAFVGVLGPATFHQGNFVSTFLCAITCCCFSHLNQGAEILLADLKVGELVIITVYNHLSSSKGGIRDAIREISDLLGL